MTEGPEYAPPRELSVEEIIARLERRFDQKLIGLLVDVADLRAIIAEWRERGEELKECADDLEAELGSRYPRADWERDSAPVRRARAALNSPAKSQT